MTTITSTQTPTRGFAGSAFTVVECTFARPANTTAYAVNDVISDSAATAKAIEFIDAGQSGCVIGGTVVVNETDTLDFDLLLFNAEPTNFLDNVALALVAADAAKLVGVLRFSNANKLPLAASNLELYRAVGGLAGAVIGANETVGVPVQPMPFASADGKLYGLLVMRTTAGWTPVSGTTFSIRLGINRGGAQ